MRIRFTYTVNIVDPETDEEVPRPKINGRFKVTEMTIDAYFRSEIADEGVVGGEFYLNLEKNIPKFEVDYWFSGIPSDRLIESLRDYTAGQLADGAGENGFELELEGQPLLVMANCSEFGEVEVIDDG